MKVTIAAASSDAARPYENLIPLVDALVGAGNFMLDGGFIENPDTWRCRLGLPLDFALLRERFEFPANVRLSPEYDSVGDFASWCSIEGPGT